MPDRTAKIASIIVVGACVGAGLTSSPHAARAADCLTEPGTSAPEGQHWRYRIERGTARHCWYLRAKDSSAPQTSPSDASARPSTAPATETAAAHALQDAHAEYGGAARANALPAGAPPSADGMSRNPPQPAPDAFGPIPQWPSSQSAAGPSARVPAADSSVSPQTVATEPTDPDPDPGPATLATVRPGTPADAAPAVSAASPAMSSARASVPLQMLFAVVVGALALAGFTASVVYRLARRKQRRLATSERRAMLWDGVDGKARMADKAADTSPWSDVPLPEAPAGPEQWAKTDLGPQLAPKAPAGGAVPSPARVQAERYEKFEELLAQLVRHGQRSDA